MSDTSDYDETPTTSAATPVVVQQELPVTDRARAEGFLSKHATARGRYESQFEDLMKQRAQAIKDAQATIEDTIQQMRDRQTGGAGGINLPLLALGAGLLSPDPSGRNSNFGQELGRGLSAMGSTVRAQRMSDVEVMRGIADLQQKKAALGDIPLADAAKLAKEQSLKEQGSEGALEKAITTSKEQSLKPFSLGSGILFDPRTNKALNAFTGQEISLNPTDAKTGSSLLGSDTHGPDFLKTVTDPALRQTIQGYGDYSLATPTMPRSPQALAYMNNIMAMVKQYNPDFDAKEYPTIQKGMKDWTGAGKMAVQSGFAKTVTGHLADLQSAAAGLGNGDFSKFNTIGNWLQSNTGDPRVQDFTTAKKAVIEELTKFLGGGHPAEGTMNDWEKTVDAANSPQQLQAAISRIVSIMHSQAQTLAENKSDALKKKITPEDLIGERASVLKDIMSTDINTPGGRLAAIRRDQNNKLQIAGKPALPAPTVAQWEANVAKLKKAPTKENQAFFDESFGPGSAALALGKR